MTKGEDVTGLDAESVNADVDVKLDIGEGKKIVGVRAKNVG
jgi:hypothetical protein